MCLGAACVSVAVAAGSARGAVPERLSPIGCDALAFSPDGRLLIGGGEDGVTRAWDRSQREVLALRGHEDSVTSLSLAPDGSRLATGSTDGTARLWELPGGRAVRVLADHSEPVSAVSIGGRGGRLITASEDGVVQAWELSSGRRLARMVGHARGVVTLAAAADARVATAASDGKLRIMDALSGSPLLVLDGGEPIHALALSPDESLLASGGEDSIRLWDVRTGESRAVLKGHTRAVSSLSYGLRGKLLASGSYDGTARLWLAQTGEPLAVLPRQAGRVFVALSADGGRLATGGEEGIRVWDLADIPSVAAARRRLEDYEEHMRLARQHRGEGRLGQAQSEFEQAAGLLRTPEALSGASEAGKAWSQEKWRRLGGHGWKAGAGAAGAAVLWGLFALARRWARRRALLGLVRRGLDSPEPAPAEAFAYYEKFLKAGGRPSALSGRELATLHAAAGREDEVLRLVGDRPAAQLLAGAEALSERELHDQACGLVETERRLSSCLEADGGADAVVGIFHRAGRLDDLLKRVPADREGYWLDRLSAALLRGRHFEAALEVLGKKTRKTPADLKAMSEALMSLGRVDEALKFSQARSLGDMTTEEILFQFKLLVKRGDMEPAHALYPEVARRRPIRDDPEVHYSYARQCEKEDDGERAAEIYRQFISETVLYQDVIERYRNLKGTPTGRTPSASAPVPAAPADVPAVSAAVPAAAALPPAGLASLPPGAKTSAPGMMIAAKYEIRRVLGEGGMGVVYEGYDGALERKVAVKQMRPEIRASARERQRFLKEARVIAKLTHPYIVSIHDIVEQDNEIYLIFDYVDGETLSALLDRKRRLSLSETKIIMSYVCEGVDCAHRHNILHRDLKPANIMVDKDGFSRVMDFGLAREARDTCARLSLTKQDIAGTPAYMSPEQHLGEAVKASDVYSLGVCLYEMLCGEVPFRGPDFLAQKERMKFRPLRAVVPTLPASTDAMIAASLEADPRKRIRNVMDFLDLVQSL